jgi:predicted aldo/keto reductase-like oxidoreductase
MKKLGFGFMRLPLTDPENRASVDMEQTKRLVDEFMSRGFEYFDTAWVYCGFNSENALREALVERYPRESFKIATKFHAHFANNIEERDNMFEEQLRKTGVEYFDYYLLHTIFDEFYKKYTELDCFNWLVQKKAEGRVKNIGFSFHDNAELLDRILTEHPEVDFVQLQINYLDWDSERIQSAKCYEVARKHGKDVIVMEPVKGGALAKVPESVEAMYKEISPDMSVPSWAIRFAAGLDGVIMVLSGMNTMEQVIDNTSYMTDFKPLEEREWKAIEEVCAIFRKQDIIPCTDCRYCMECCPMKIPIPALFACLNGCRAFKNWNTDYYYEIHTDDGPKASDCIKCGMCEKACPQHLKIRDLLEQVTAEFEGK